MPRFSFFDFRPVVRNICADNKLPFVTLGLRSYIIGAEFFNPNIIPSHTFIGSYSSIAETLHLLIAQNHDYRAVTTFPFDHITHELPEEFSSIRGRDEFKHRMQVIIGHDVWIGRDVTIMGGVRIGTGAVIGANAVVAKNIPPYAIAVGNPARVIKYRFDSEIIWKLQAIKWWTWSQEKILSNYDLINDPRAFVERFYSPELEIYQRSEIGNYLRDLKSHGVRIFATVLDIEDDYPLWKTTMENFSESRLSNAVLICYAMQNVTDEDFRQAYDFANRLNANIIVSDLSIDALRESDFFITTRNFNSMAALDVLYDKDIEIRCAFDEAVFY